MALYTNEEDYLKALEKESVLPEGFLTGSVNFIFNPAERDSSVKQKMSLSAILLDTPTPAFGAVFTKNAFPGHPLTVARKLMNRENCSGVIINNKISNVACPGGEQDSETVIQEAGKIFNCEGFLFPSSTGIIGWKLPVADILSALPRLKDCLQRESVLSAARGIMTTDRFPKVRSVAIGEGRIVGICKGAGMIEPNLATMLVFLLTDIQLERDYVRDILPEICNRTFNRISVDGDQSTSDSVFLFSSNRKPAVDPGLFKSALTDLCRNLAEDLVRNGEGTSHVIEVSVLNAPDEECAVGIGKALVNSPLTKAAVYGNDPNVGRYIQAIGDYLGNCGKDFISPEDFTIEIGEEPVFRNGSFHLDKEKEIRLYNYLKDCSFDEKRKGYPLNDRNVRIRIILRNGQAGAVVLGSDLSHEYIHENADYRT